MADHDFDFAYSHCEGLVRDLDPDRYWASLFAPAEKRGHLHALYAFSIEIARVREAVREALVGEIRLQWWRDALQGEMRGDVRANPVAAALDDTIVKFRLPRQALVNLIDARIFDLYDDPMPSLNDLEGYCGETSSVLIQLASMILADGADPGSADAAGHAGVAYAITGLLRAFPWHARQGQIYIPAEILARHGVVRDDIVAGRGGPGLDQALADMRAVARRHVQQARELRSTISPQVSPAFQGLALVGPYLKAMERRGYDPFHTEIELPRWRKIWALWHGPF
ncbi:phytoene/squalene synthase family protein [Microvirga terricola]|uniref:Squalene/phytoene synthase family protein n=1 Tax=Microvirga terricola TaxID=2719797 RepID=A0ABX0VDL0_9HYPH|nr:phytoene/squalene synthase family protein [Microvirga terricola]NIX77254.1 squalene/phytoene synthase family protein [Microvirga terricola]